jgi:uncharacterized protein
VSDRPLQIGVAELRRRLGTRRAVERVVPLDGLAISTASVPDPPEVTVRVELESIAKGIVAEGTVGAAWEGECRRCLRPVSGEVETDVREIFEVDHTEGETYPLAEDTVDLEPMVRDAVLLALPLAPLCGPDCAGPAPEVFPTGPAVEPDRPPDPRWAALDELRFDRDVESGEAGSG